MSRPEFLDAAIKPAGKVDRILRRERGGREQQSEQSQG
jgi:hypothetical protein